MTHHDLKEAADWSGRAMSRAADDAATRASSIYDLASDLAQSALDQARHSAHGMNHYYRKGNRAVSRQIEGQSIPTLLLVAGVSFALGWFARDLKED